MSSINESFTWHLLDWWITCNVHLVLFCILHWQCSEWMSGLSLAIMLCLNWSCCCVCQLCLFFLSDSEDKELYESVPYGSSRGPSSPPHGHHDDHYVCHQINEDSVCYHQKSYLDIHFHLHHCTLEREERISLVVWGRHLNQINMPTVIMDIIDVGGATTKEMWTFSTLPFIT